MTGETPAMAIAGMACSAAGWLFGIHEIRDSRRLNDCCSNQVVADHPIARRYQA